MIYTRPQFERKVYNKLCSYGIDLYFPTHVEIRQWHDRRKKLEVPVFPSYLFAKIDAHDMVKVYGVSGFVRFLSTGNELDIISDERMESLQQLFSNDFEVSSIKIQRREKVKVINGPLIGLEGVILKDTEGSRVLVQMEVLNRFIKTELPVSDLEKLNEQEPLSLVG
ncbi:MAG: UpxY family transcription antiterminator [Bacteroidota bacterium]